MSFLGGIFLHIIAWTALQCSPVHLNFELVSPLDQSECPSVTKSVPFAMLLDCFLQTINVTQNIQTKFPEHIRRINGQFYFKVYFPASK